MSQERELFRRIGRGLETLLVTWLGAGVTLTDDQVLAALEAMGTREAQVVMLRGAGLTSEEVAAREGYGVVQVQVLTIAGLRQAAARLWPGGRCPGRDMGRHPQSRKLAEKRHLAVSLARYIRYKG
jgi:hypothetical protein